jgi:DNA-binding HxlR family transcriptional regulator
MRLLGSAWTAQVIWFLREDQRCFTELSIDLQGVSAKMLTACLRRLERAGIVERGLNCRTSPPTVWYALTPVGRELSDALVKVVEAAQRLERPQAAGA